MMSAGRKAKELISQYSDRCSLRRQKLRTARRLDWTGWAKRPPPGACRGLGWGGGRQRMRRSAWKRVRRGSRGSRYFRQELRSPTATFYGSERESDETATFTQLSSPAEPRGTRRWSPPSAWPSTADTAGSYSPGRG